MTNYNEADYAQIDGFIHDRLPDEEKQRVVQRLQTDPNFAAEVTWFRNLLNGYQQLRTRETTEAINQRLRNRPATAPVAQPVTTTTNRPATLQPNRTTPRPVRRHNRVPIAWVAGASVVAVLSVSVWFVVHQPEPQQAVATPAKTVSPQPTVPATVPEPTVPHPPISLSDRTLAYVNAPPKLSGTIPVAVKPAVEALNGHHPDVALRLLQRIGVAKPTPTRPDEPLFGASPDPASPAGSSTAQSGRVRAYRQLFTGLSYLQKKQPALALHSLNRVTGALRNTANWYSALCYLQLDQTETAKQRLQQIAAAKAHPYRVDAQTLLEEF